MHYLLFYEAIDNYVEKRAPYREEHLKVIQSSYDQGDLVMAGATGDPASGGVFIFKVEDVKKVEAFAASDPYVQNGLIKSWYVKPWKVVIGD